MAPEIEPTRGVSDDSQRSSTIAHNEAIALARQGAYALAANRLVEAVELTGIVDADVRSLKALWQVAKQAGQLRRSVIAGIAASQRDPLDYAFARRVLQSLADCPLSASRAPARLP